jgi:hypothetical protein
MKLLRKLLKKQTEMEYLLAHGMKVGKSSHIFPILPLTTFIRI